MFNLGLFELTLFGIIALIVLGPEKLPQAARTVGKWYGLFRRASQRLQSEIVSELELHEAQAAIQKELAEIRATEARIKQQVSQLQNTLNHTQPANPNSANTNSELPSTAIDHSSAKDASAGDAWQQIGNYAQPPNEIKSSAATPAITTPMTNRFFLLGAYDKAKRLPPAPFLPDYRADALLYHSSHSYAAISPDTHSS